MIGHAPSPFVGRDEAFAGLRRCYAAAESGSAQVMLVSGEAGIGKTRLVLELLADVGETSLVLGTHCLELAAAEIPLAPVHGLIHRAYRRLGNHALLEAAGPYASEITALEPALGTAEAAVDQLRLFAAVRHVLESLSASSPVVVVVEDLQWADEATLGLLRFLGATVDDARLLVLGTERTGKGPSQPLVELQRLPRSSSVNLGPLTIADAERLARSLTERQSGTDVDAEAIARRSGGNPLYLEELATAGRSELPLSLQALLQTQLDGLSAAARTVVELLAVAVPPVGYDELLAATQAQADVLDSALSEARERQLLDLRDRRIGLRHALIGEAARAGLDSGPRRRLHAAWAEALESTSPVLQPQAALTIAHHRAEAGEPGPAIRAALDGARAAEMLDLHEIRATLLDRVVDLAASSDLDTTDIDEAEVLLQSARAHALAGLPGELERLETAIDRVRPDDVDLLVQLLVQRAGAEAQAGRPAMAALERALHVLPAQGHERARAQVLAEYADYLLTDLRADEGVPMAEEAVLLARAAGDGKTEAQALRCLAAALIVDDPIRSIELHHEAIEVADRARAYWVMVTTMFNIINPLAEVLGEYEQSIRDNEGFLRLARQRHVEHKMGFLHLSSAGSALALGRLDEMEAHLDRVGPIEGNVHLEVEFLFRRAWAALIQGRSEPARAFVAEQETPHYFQWQTAVTLIRSWLTWLDDGPDAAAAVLLPDVQERAQPGKEMYLLTEPDVVLSLARYGRMGASANDTSADAVQVLASVRDSAMDRLPHHPLAAVLHATLAGYDGVDATERWREAARACRASEGPVYWRIDTLIQLAETTPARGEALDALDAAEHDALAMNAHPQLDWIAAARQRLSDRPALAGLTKREVEILGLVCQGLTNSQIGERLFISSKTASVHVSNILTKTGTPNRRQAARWARDHGFVRSGAPGPA